MKNEHNIDRLFQESFKDFEVSPPENAWQNIERRLKADSSKKVIPLWRRLTAAVAIVAILLLAGSQWFITPDLQNSSTITDNSSDVAPQNTTDKNSPIPPGQESTPVIIASSSGKSPKNEQVDDSSEQDSNVASAVLKPSSSSSSTKRQSFAPDKAESVASVSILSDIKPLASSNSGDALNGIAERAAVIEFSQNFNFAGLQDENDDPGSTANSLQEVAEFLALEDEKNKAKEEKQKFKPSWHLKPQISPVFYGNMSGGSALDESLAQNSGQGDVDLSYGLNVGYQVSEKVKIRTGINRVNLNYTTNDLFTLPGSEISALANVNAADGLIASVVTSQQLDNLVDDQQFGRQEAIASDLRQSIGFIEFPLEVEYKLLDKKFGINIIGGASTFLLNDNSIDIVNAQGTTTLGEANNINNLSFSTNFALGFDYSLSKRLLLNLEPTFKYQLNTFESGTTDFQPYFLGIYSGVVFKF